MLTAYLTSNYITLMIISLLVVIVMINRKNSIPATELFYVMIALLTAITLLDTVGGFCENGEYLTGMGLEWRIRLRTIVNTLSYILRPFVIMTEVMVIIPKEVKLKPLTAIPALMNMIIYSTAFSGSGIAFIITDDNHFSRGPLGSFVFIAQLFYVIVLTVISVKYFNESSTEKNAIVILIILQSILTSLLEYEGTVVEAANAVTALAVLEYYIYLSYIYQQKMREAIAVKDLAIEKDRLIIFRNQIQPHFIYNSLSIIRSLAKRDSGRAVSCIDSFSDYLKAHIGALDTEDLIPLEKELENVRVYLDLVRADKTRKLDVVYDIKSADFMLPSLSLEPVVENAVNHGISREGGVITVSSLETEDAYLITVTDNGTARNSPSDDMPYHMGVGIENTRKRLMMQCRGTLEMDMRESGTTVTVTIPKNGRSEQNEGTYSG